MTQNDDYKADPYKNEADYSALEQAVVIVAKERTDCPIHQRTAAGRNNFPGLRRTALPANSLPDDQVLVKTAGNALQAVPRAVFSWDDNMNNPNRSRLVAVTVPENVRPGDCVYVQHHAPDVERNDNQPPLLMQAVIPEGAHAGSTFFVQVPDSRSTRQQQQVVEATGEALSSSANSNTASAAAAVVVEGQEAAGDLYLRVGEEQPVANQRSNNHPQQPNDQPYYV